MEVKGAESGYFELVLSYFTYKIKFKLKETWKK